MQLVGYSREEVMGSNLVREFITDDFKTAVQTVLDQALHGIETANFQFPLITKNGERIEVLLNATTRRDEQGNVIGVVGIGQDITARLAQEREYSKLIDTANAVCLRPRVLVVELYVPAITLRNTRYLFSLSFSASFFGGSQSLGWTLKGVLTFGTNAP
jgi:PAS domain S-box-containing protein